MKKWTVMLIPHDHGQTRTVSLNGVHIWLMLLVLAGLSFSTAFFFERHRIVGAHMRRLEEAARNVGHSGTALAQTGASSIEHQTEIDRIRSQYESQLDAITTELSELYDLESQVRTRVNLPSRQPAAAAALSIGGQGGPTDGADGSALARQLRVRPATLIYGLSNPSADLVVEEIDLRAENFRALLKEVDAQQDEFERVPGYWPLIGAKHRVYSSFGWRRDPFTHRLTQHSGTDIVGPYGCSVVATAKGVVVFSQWENDYGHLIKIDHGNGIQTWYAHLSRRVAEVGQEVQRGDIIGKLGNTGRSTGPHLHYEIQVNGKAVDAERYLGG